MIRIVKEIDLELFEAWSGALKVLNAIKEHEQGSEILEMMDDLINMSEDVTETWLNDFLWFDAVDIIMEHFEIDLFDSKEEQ